MPFLTKCGQILDIITGGFTLPTEDEIKLQGISTILSGSNVTDKRTLNCILKDAQNVQQAFNAIPEGRTVEIDSYGHGMLTLEKKGGIVQIKEMN